MKLATNFKYFPALTAIYKDFQGLEFLFEIQGLPRTFKVRANPGTLKFEDFPCEALYPKTSTLIRRKFLEL